MMKYYFLLLFIAFTTCQLIQAQESITKQVLFIGNSYTYFWNLPQNFNEMTKAKNENFHAIQSTAGGVNWGQHWRGDRALQTTKILKEQEFDIVVLQNHSMRSIEAPDSMMLYGEKFSKLIKRNGAEIYLYMTWARAWDPFMQSTITEKYQELAEKINAKVVPVGLAWEKARQLRPGFELYFDDGSHQSPLGTYLSACVFFRVLTGKSAVGIPNRLTTTDHEGQKLYLNIQTKEDALFCQKLADATVEEWEKRIMIKVE